jgi:eukaryotic-like serine/threonine-protein kinase
LALAGDTRTATTLADNLNRRFPEDTFVVSCYLPTLRVAIALELRDPAGALRELAEATPYELGVACGLFPVYLRGLAYLRSNDGAHAAIEFQKIVDHPGVVLNAPIGLLALLGLGRSYALSNEPAQAKSSYDAFLREWQNADAEVPVLTQAKTEWQLLETSARP